MQQMKRIKKYRDTKLVYLKYICPKLNKEVIADRISARSNSQACDVCGSYGITYVEILYCECGIYHEVELNSWWECFYNIAEVVAQSRVPFCENGGCEIKSHLSPLK